MAENTKLDVHAREAAHSRENRRLRREGQVPGVLYGGGEDPVGFSVAARTLRTALAAKGAVLELSVDGGSGTPAVLKDTQRHPVRGEITHVDLLRVDLTQTIHASVTVELIGGEDAPGIKEGGILEHVTREITVEALPNDIPERLQVDVSGMQIHDSLGLDAVIVPEVETETAVVGEEGAEAAEAADEGDGGGSDD